MNITAPTATKLRFFYKTDEFSDAYHHQRSRDYALRAGHNRVLLELSVEDLTGRLRFDPGSAPGEYELHSLQVYEP